jgi:hypothetical protein
MGKSLSVASVVAAIGSGLGLAWIVGNMDTAVGSFLVKVAALVLVAVPVYLVGRLLVRGASGVGGDSGS